jgi:hypothetical protein
VSAQLEKWTQQVVAFDTNAYRALVGTATPEQARLRAKRLAEAERKKGIQALAYPTVIWELIAHLASPEDSSYDVSRAAVAAVVEHTAVVFEGQKVLALWASPDLQLCSGLWDVVPTNLLMTDDLIRAAAMRVSEDPSESGLNTIRKDLTTLARKLTDAETSFAVSMQQHLMSNVQKEANLAGSTATTKELRTALCTYLDTDLAHEAVALAHVLRASSYCPTSDSRAEIERKARFVAQKFPVAIQLYIDIVKKIAESNWDLTTGKGPNYLWDLQVAFLIGDDHTVLGRPTSVVTSDRDIIEAARSRKMGNAVQNLAEYRKSLGL